VRPRRSSAEASTCAERGPLTWDSMQCTTTRSTLGPARMCAHACMCVCVHARTHSMWGARVARAGLLLRVAAQITQACSGMQGHSSENRLASNSMNRGGQHDTQHTLACMQAQHSHATELGGSKHCARLAATAIYRGSDAPQSDI